tara:strand:- start:1039 stop:1560 length:522 start_codon:yes stop_codon:yes gene_type:complete
MTYFYMNKNKSRSIKFNNNIKKKRNYTIKKRRKKRQSNAFIKQQTRNSKLNKKLYNTLMEHVNKPPEPPTVGKIINKYIPMMKKAMKKKDYKKAAMFNYLILAAVATYVPVEPQFDKGLLVEQNLGPILSNVDTHVKYHTGYAYPKKNYPTKFTRKEKRKLLKRKTRKRKRYK